MQTVSRQARFNLRHDIKYQYTGVRTTRYGRETTMDISGDRSREGHSLEADRWYVLFVMTLVYTVNIADRFVVSTLIEPIKIEFQLSDSAVGLLTGAALAIFYVAAGIPLGILADRANRKRMIAIALTSWSLLTALCGLTQNFWQLLFVRMAVGVGEAGGIPPSQSLLADKFQPRMRAFAMSLFSIGAAAGAAIGASLGGYLVDAYGWRVVLYAFGLAGLPLALLLAITVKEPLRGRLDSRPVAKMASMGETFRFVLGQKALLHILAGATVLTYWGWGMVWWTPAFLLRSHHISLSDSGQMLGLMHGVGGIGATLVTAYLMKQLAYRDARFQTWFIALATLLPTVPSIFAYSLGSDRLSILALWFFVPTIYIYIGPSFALVQNLVPAIMRSQVCAWFLFCVNIANLLIAPVLIGSLSDVLKPHLENPAESLRYILVGTAFTGFWAAWHYYTAGRYLRADLVRAGSEANL
nr:MFS transporter [Sphingobium boeckii]